MRTVILLTMLAVACTTTQPVVQQQPLDTSFYTPPNTNEFVVNDKRQQELETAKTEERQYWESLDNITAKVREQALNIEICKEAAPNKSECTILKNNYCQVDVLLDSRGGHHVKPFCR